MSKDVSKEPTKHGPLNISLPTSLPTSLPNRPPSPPFVSFLLSSPHTSAPLLLFITYLPSLATLFKLSTLCTPLTHLTQATAQSSAPPSVSPTAASPNGSPSSSSALHPRRSHVPTGCNLRLRPLIIHYLKCHGTSNVPPPLRLDYYHAVLQGTSAYLHLRSLSASPRGFPPGGLDGVDCDARGKIDVTEEGRLRFYMDTLTANANEACRAPEADGGRMKTFKGLHKEYEAEVLGSSSVNVRGSSRPSSSSPSVVPPPPPPPPCPASPSRAPALLPPALATMSMAPAT
mmetsp:Transcript_7602/g.15111  ORF Transcript_7602/g.15111 Transcript_7602/m.15111 type:complete len:288 (+) Transcript_7602:183-1046(+)